MKFLLLIALLFFLCLSVCGCSELTGDGRVYSMRYGQAYCTSKQWSECGLTLSGCTDGRVYYCMTDVAVKE